MMETEWERQGIRHRTRMVGPSAVVASLGGG
jgi:hypothetical protein